MTVGLLTGLRNGWRRTEAAVVVQNLLLSHKETWVTELDSRRVAGELVNEAWFKNSHQFDGFNRNGPHKLSLAASGLAFGLRRDGPSIDAAVFSFSLYSLLREVTDHHNRYNFGQADEYLIGDAAQTIAWFNQEMSKTELVQEMEGILAKTGSAKITWEDWLLQYKQEAGRHHPSLLINEKGFSLIDILEDQPLRRAYLDGIDPLNLGRQFGQNFDITSIKF